MSYRFNSGYGAIQCDYCGIIICTGLDPEKYHLIRRINGSEEGDPDLCPDAESCKDGDMVPRSLIAQIDRDGHG